MSGEGALPCRPAMIVIDGDVVPDSRVLPIVAGRREGAEWRVWISCEGHRTELTVDRARQMARDILNVCDVLDGAHAGVSTAGASPAVYPERVEGLDTNGEGEAKPRVEHGATVLGGRP
ncbi:MAG: hypothetical protein B7Y36_08340 [Novosphingobium sp. 28-62-57]|uniref:hypothetical protein n=1 Tax=unclassified Novosphingobium TaxID=2644732 RepID=UPI000BD60A2B|nr:MULTISPECIES: hypothetical protein [unclassified Novosphingobium]OYW47932.1 MAG: hypothetical protein B7Z36_01430 [Novosphingobium sp. 12-63-9]OYZ10825.1 MAG: hypothetical protein B7Y36_08340 [Novosphingobium sp. 28-62-57]OZA32838.1 MAG: hypothetical protein B7X92_12050 [Novosphingobium sp. 17-62-9]HQS70015.1 hypothetical protein [Novosphingobium sp.]